ncbi:hypothetical protein EYZ11_011739 [Aspergillus tanneri]|uniref:Uncharacterized protein n=1 Tax=Aspergillus tanneri TaxID=1220188 RepID=A0A4S3J7D3_9EURO|nr:hypothetical protein EYZ11_011739 [Aspergillus tanneri]
MHCIDSKESHIVARDSLLIARKTLGVLEEAGPPSESFKFFQEIFSVLVEKLVLRQTTDVSTAESAFPKGLADIQKGFGFGAQIKQEALTLKSQYSQTP